MLFCLHDSKETSTSLNEVTPSPWILIGWVPRGKPRTMVPKMILILNLARTERDIGLSDLSLKADSVHLQQLARCRNFAREFTNTAPFSFQLVLAE